MPNPNDAEEVTPTYKQLVALREKIEAENYSNVIDVTPQKELPDNLLPEFSKPKPIKRDSEFYIKEGIRAYRAGKTLEYMPKKLVGTEHATDWHNGWNTANEQKITDFQTYLATKAQIAKQPNIDNQKAKLGVQLLNRIHDYRQEIIHNLNIRWPDFPTAYIIWMKEFAKPKEKK